VTYTGEADYLRVESGRLVRSGVRSEVTDDDAAALAGRGDVTVHEPDDDD
jgi:hypothetical protein